MEYLGIDFDLLILIQKALLDSITEQKYEIPLFIRALYYLQAFSLMIIAISGFSLYLWYLNRSDNTSRILNNLNGFLALDGIYISILKFIHLVLIDYLSEESPIMCILDIYRVPLVSLTNLIISMISVATVLRHFFPQKYLDYSERWNNKICGIVLLTLSILHLLRAGKTCGLCDRECIVNEVCFVLKVSTPCSLLVVISVTIDSVWGFTKIISINYQQSGSSDLLL